MAVLAHESFNAFLITCRNKEIIMKIKLYTITCAVVVIVFSLIGTFTITITELEKMTLYILISIFYVGFMILNSME